MTEDQLFPWERQWYAIKQEQKEMAFMKWQRSGYRDLEARREFLDHYHDLIMFMHKVRNQ